MLRGPGVRGRRRLAAVLVSGPLLLAVPARAHTELVSSSPRHGAETDAVPSRVELRFNEEIAEPAYVVVTGPEGATVADGKAAVDGALVTQSLRGERAGSYRVAYRVFSADGHPVVGELRFRVVAAQRREAPDEATDPQAEPSWQGGGAVVGWSALGAVAAGAVALAIRRRPR